MVGDFGCFEQDALAPASGGDEALDVGVWHGRPERQRVVRLLQVVDGKRQVLCGDAEAHDAAIALTRSRPAFVQSQTMTANVGTVSRGAVPPRSTT